MHIILASPYSLPHPGGIEFVVEQLWERLAARGCQVTMVTCDTGIPTGTSQQGWKTRIGLPALNTLEKYDIPFPIFDPLVLRRTLRDILPSADVLHIHGTLFMSSVVAAAMARRRGIPVILTEHVGKIPFDRALFDGLQHLAFETLGRYCCRQCDAVIVLNRRVGREIRSLVRPHTEISKIPNGVDTDLFRPADSDERKALRRKWHLARPTALFVGRFVRKKGVDLVLEAAHSEFDLVLCGRNGVKLAKQQSVRVVGPVEQRELSELYQASDVLVLPSRGEGFPLVVQEAMACGLPVIVTDNDENREYLNESVARFTTREPGAIRENILALLRSPDRRAQMGRAARRWAVEQFDWERTVDQYLELYRGHAKKRS